MLERLIIENVALIDRLDLELGRGFTVLTGETGAGKSIIIDGIELVLGGRGSRELITHGKQKCRVLGHVGMCHTTIDITRVHLSPDTMAELELNPTRLREIPVRIEE